MNPVLLERESPGAATCVLVGPADSSPALARLGVRHVLWLIDAATAGRRPVLSGGVEWQSVLVDRITSDELDRTIARFLLKDPRRLPHLVVTGAVLTQPTALYESATVVLHRVFERANRARVTRERCGFLWQKNLLLNLTEFVRRRLPPAWAGRLEGLPAFVVGAGPSLDVSIAALARVADRGVVIAADSAMRTLARHGVPVDFLVSIDAFKQPENCLPDGEEPARIVLAPVSSPRWREIEAPERTFFLSSRQITEDWLAASGVARAALAATESCGSTAIELARLLGCRPIVLFGFDLAADAADPARRHATGAHPALHTRPAEPSAAALPRVPGNYVESLPTYLFTDLQDLNDRLAGWPADLVLNVNDRGARLRHATLVHPTQFALAVPGVAKRPALAHLPLPAWNDHASVRAALAALGAQGAHGCRAMDDLRRRLAEAGPAALVEDMRRLFATGDFARAMGAFAMKTMPHLAPPVEGDAARWFGVLDELEELCCLAEAMYELPVT